MGRAGNYCDPLFHQVFLDHLRHEITQLKSVQAFRKSNHHLVTDGKLKAFKSEVQQRKLIQNIRTVFLVEGL